MNANVILYTSYFTILLYIIAAYKDAERKEEEKERKLNDELEKTNDDI